MLYQRSSQHFQCLTMICHIRCRLAFYQQKQHPRTKDEKHFFSYMTLSRKHFYWIELDTQTRDIPFFSLKIENYTQNKNGFCVLIFPWIYYIYITYVNWCWKKIRYKWNTKAKKKKLKLNPLHLEHIKHSDTHWNDFSSLIFSLLGPRTSRSWIWLWTITQYFNAIFVCTHKLWLEN